MNKNVHVEIMETPTVKAAFKILSEGERSFLVLIWDEESGKPALVTNAGPVKTINALIRTLDALVEGRGSVVGMDVTPKPTH